MNYVKVMNTEGKYINWNITDETDRVYEIFYRGLVTLLYKSKCFTYDNQLHSSEIKMSQSLDDISDRVTGSEDCSVCGRKIYNLNKAMVLENSDNYVCKKCAKTLNSRVKSANNLQ